ncbi:hypothetical protein [Pseudomonas fontis]|uniref:Phage protein n=1 Tax=Pseudomonas fontis TaxID=2942633 RepID=A0ABT5P054_9PSED|nr:hypothetical protein [Pseudomonas fontis]MDD0977097.1 hypothetical protein [Pseudomonas fontis]MDD0993790.1 hypothetical protein [Pseudomonas fontis]
MPLLPKEIIVADFVLNGCVVVQAATVAINLQQLEDEGFITSVQPNYPLAMHDGQLAYYCKHLNSEVGEEDAFGSSWICTRVGAFLTIYRLDGESGDLGRKAINDAADDVALAEGAKRDW